MQMLENAINEEGGSQARFAEAHGFPQQTLNTWMRGRVPTRRFQMQIASILNISDDMMDELIEEAEEKRALSPGMRAYWERNRRLSSARKQSRFDEALEAGEAHIDPNGAIVSGPAPEMSREKPVPVYGQAVGGDVGEYEFNGQALDWVARPPSLSGVGNAYAVFVDGESMVPAYKPGQTVWVHPTRPPRRGDDVVVQIHGTDEQAIPRGYIKEFVGWQGSKLVLHQHNPVKDIEFDRTQVRTVHTIVFSERA